MIINSNPPPGVRGLLQGSLLPFTLAAAVGWCLHSAHSTAAPSGHNAKDSGCAKRVAFTATELEREPAAPELWLSAFQPGHTLTIAGPTGVGEHNIEDGTYTISYLVIDDSEFWIELLKGERPEITRKEH